MKKVLAYFCFILIMIAGAVSSTPSPKEVFTQGKYYEALYRDFPVGIAFVDKEGRFLHANALLCTFLGRNEEELKRLTWEDVTVRQDIEIDRLSSLKVISGEERSYTLFKQYTHKRGDAIWARLTVIGIRSMDGTFEHFVSVVEPLSSSVSFDAEISTRLKEIQSALSNVGSGGNTTFANFLTQNWSIVIPWFVVSIISIAGVIFRVQSDSKAIKQLADQNKNLENKVNEITKRS